MRYECFGVGNIIRGISRVADNWMSAQLGYLISHISTARVCTKCKCIQLSTCSLICPESFYRSFSVRCLARSVNISVSELISCACASVSLLTRKKHLDFFARTHTQRIIALDFHAVHIKPKVCVKVWIFFIFSGVRENVSIWKTKMLRGMRAGTVWSSAVEGSQIKKSTHWHCFSLFINQIHHNECVCVCVDR